MKMGTNDKRKGTLRIKTVQRTEGNSNDSHPLKDMMIPHPNENRMIRQWNL